MKLLVATDFSQRSDHALERAVMLAQQLSADLLIAHVVDDDRLEHVVEADKVRAETFLKVIASKLDLPSGRCEWQVARGEAFDGILRLCEDEAPSLVVLGAHRRRILRDVFIGTTAERVLRSAKLPVLMVNTKPEGPYRRILLAVDFDAGSTAALRTVLTLGISRGLVMTALHAFDAPARGLMMRTPAPRSEIEGYVAQERRRAMTKLTAYLQLHSEELITAGVDIVEISTASAIRDYSHRKDSDLIVMCTRGRSGLDRVFLGSVADEVLRRSDVDVLAVPPADGMVSNTVPRTPDAEPGHRLHD